LNSNICLSQEMVDTEKIVGLLGSPDGVLKNEWTTPSGAEFSNANMDKATGYAYCTQNWCVKKPEESIFGYLPGTKWEDFYNCEAPYDNRTDAILLEPPAECEACCEDITDQIQHADCIEECSTAEAGAGVMQCVIDLEDAATLSDNKQKKCGGPTTTPKPTPAPKAPSVAPSRTPDDRTKPTPGKPTPGKPTPAEPTPGKPTPGASGGKSGLATCRL
jgi:hypothetical protein